MIRMRLCALNTIHHGAFNKVETKLPNTLHCTLPSKLQDAPKYTPNTLPSTPLSTFSSTLQDAPNCTRWHTPSLLDYTLLSKLSRRSQVSSQDALKHTPENALKDTPNCTRWHTPSLLDCALPSKLSRRSQAHS